LGFTVAVVPVVHANEWDQATKVEFSQTVQIPGSTLPAGTYWFLLANTGTGRNIVQIFSSGWSVLYATLDTVPTERRITSDSAFTFAERPTHKPEAMLKWFYPGETTGHEFLYSRTEEQELAQDAHQGVIAGSVGSFAGGH
jgi:hypothetical protein